MYIVVVVVVVDKAVSMLTIVAVEVGPGASQEQKPPTRLVAMFSMETILGRFGFCLAWSSADSMSERSLLAGAVAPV